MKHQWEYDCRGSGVIRCIVCGKEHESSRGGWFGTEITFDCPGPPKEYGKSDLEFSKNDFEKLLAEMREAHEEQDARFRAALGKTKERPGLPEKFETLGPLQYFTDGRMPMAPDSVPTMKAVRDTINAIIGYLKAREKE
jgi:hypothetical protein